MKLKTQVPPRRNIGYETPEKSRTEQSTEGTYSMAQIKRKLDKGFPIASSKDVFYSTEIPQFHNLQETVEFIDTIRSKYDQLPHDIRKAMGHNILNLDNFINDPNNQEILITHGLIPKKTDGITEILTSIKNHLVDTSKNKEDSTKKTSPDSQNKP